MPSSMAPRALVPEAWSTPGLGLADAIAGPKDSGNTTRLPGLSIAELQERFASVEGTGHMCNLAATSWAACVVNRSACGVLSPAWEQGVWALQDNVLPNFFTQKKLTVEAYREAFVAVLHSQKAGSETLRDAYREVCPRDPDYLGSVRTPRPVWGSTNCTGGDRQCTIFASDRLMTLTAVCGNGFQACSGCFPSSMPMPSPRPPPVALLHIFREPTSRLVSAFRWCTWEQPMDVLCDGYMANMTGLSYQEMARATAEEKQELHTRHPLLRWTKSSLEAFAGHWGNYETRRLMDNALLGSECDGNHADAVSAAVADLGLPSAGAAFAVPGTLGRMFTAVGLLERFDETMAVFTKAVGLQHWFSVAARLGQDHIDEQVPLGTNESMEEAVLRLNEDARASEAIQGAIAEDVLVYGEVERLFQRQIDVAKERDEAAAPKSEQEPEDGTCPKPAAWCTQSGATNEAKECGGIQGHFCQTSGGKSGFRPCDQSVNATWGGDVKCVAAHPAAACACSSTCSRDAALRSASGHCGQAVGEGDACEHERLFTPSQPVGVVVLERNEVYRANDIVYCDAEDDKGCTRARLDARTIMCEKIYRGTLLRQMLAATCEINGRAAACDDGCEARNAAIAEPHPGFSYTTHYDAAHEEVGKMSGCRAATERLQGRCLGKGFLMVGEAMARLETLSGLIEAARGNCTPAKDDELIVPLRMGDMLPESAEDVVQSVKRALASAPSKSVRSVVFNAVMHYGNNLLYTGAPGGKWVRTAHTDQTNLQFLEKLFKLAKERIGVPLTFRSEPVLDTDLCYLVHSPLLLITAENRTENEFGRLAGGSFPMLIGELRARSPTNALQRTLFNDAPWRMVLSDGSHVRP